MIGSWSTADAKRNMPPHTFFILVYPTLIDDRPTAREIVLEQFEAEWDSYEAKRDKEQWNGRELQ